MVDRQCRREENHTMDRKKKKKIKVISKIKMSKKVE